MTTLLFGNAYCYNDTYPVMLKGTFGAHVDAVNAIAYNVTALSNGVILGWAGLSRLVKYNHTEGVKLKMFLLNDAGSIIIGDGTSAEVDATAETDGTFFNQAFNFGRPVDVQAGAYKIALVADWGTGRSTVSVSTTMDADASVSQLSHFYIDYYNPDFGSVDYAAMPESGYWMYASLAYTPTGLRPTSKVFRKSGVNVLRGFVP